MSGKHIRRDGDGRRSRRLLAALFALAVALFTASAVYAGLSAQAPAPSRSRAAR